MELDHIYTSASIQRQGGIINIKNQGRRAELTALLVTLTNTNTRENRKVALAFHLSKYVHDLSIYSIINENLSSNNITINSRIQIG